MLITCKESYEDERLDRPRLRDRVISVLNKLIDREYKKRKYFNVDGIKIVVSGCEDKSREE